LKDISNDYTDLMKQLQSEYEVINANMSSITNKYDTGYLDQLTLDKDSGYLDMDEDNLVRPVKKAIDVRLDDIDDMISQTNATYTLGTITAMTLLIAWIFMLRK